METFMKIRESDDMQPALLKRIDQLLAGDERDVARGLELLKLIESGQIAIKAPLQGV